MINRIISNRLRKVFTLRVENYMAFCASFPEDIRHETFGDNALGGARHSRDQTIEWYARIARLMPGLSFKVQDVRVTGWPWATNATVIWSNQFEHDGQTFANCGCHIFQLKWGKLRELLIYSDTAAMEAALSVLADAGIDEAAAPPIGQPNG